MSGDSDPTIAVQAVDGEFRGLPATVESALTGLRLTFLEHGIDARGEYLRVETFAGPGAAGAPRHVHPNRQERVDVLSGRAIYELDGDERVALAGEWFVVPAGVPHTVRNGGDGTLLCHTEVRPPLEFEAFSRTTYGLTRDGSRLGPLQLTATMYRFRDDTRLAGLPWPVQRPLLRAGAWLASKLGVQGTYPEFTGRGSRGKEDERPA